MCTSSQSSELVLPDKKGYRLVGAGKYVAKLPDTGLCRITMDGDDALVSLTAANRVEILGNNLLIRPVFWDAKSKLDSKLVFRNQVLTVFQVKQLSNKRDGLVIGVRRRKE